MKPSSLRFAGLLLIGAIAAPVLASVGKPLSLTVLPDQPVGGGDKISVSLKVDPADLGKEENYALLVAGTQLGSFRFFELTLEVIPTGFFFIGEFPIAGPNKGTIAFDVNLPNPLPPGLDGTILYLQGVSGGPGGDGGTYEYEWHESPIDNIELVD